MHSYDSFREHEAIARQSQSSTVSDKNSERYRLGKEGDKKFPLHIRGQEVVLFSKSHTANNSITNAHGGAVRVIDFFQDAKEAIAFANENPTLLEDELLIHKVHTFKLITNKKYTSEDDELERIDTIMQQNSTDYEETLKEFEEHKQKLKAEAKKREEEDAKENALAAENVKADDDEKDVDEKADDADNVIHEQPSPNVDNDEDDPDILTIQTTKKNNKTSNQSDLNIVLLDDVDEDEEDDAENDTKHVEVVPVSRAIRRITSNFAGLIVCKAHDNSNEFIVSFLAGFDAEDDAKRYLHDTASDEYPTFDLFVIDTATFVYLSNIEPDEIAYRHKIIHDIVNSRLSEKKKITDVEKQAEKDGKKLKYTEI